MNYSKRLPPMQTKNGVRIPSALQIALNKDQMVFNIYSKPIKMRSFERQNEELSEKQICINSIQKNVVRCRSTKNISISRSKSNERSTSITSFQVSSKQIANLPYITAKSWAIYQISSNKIIYGKKQKRHRQVASLTKIMNLITIIELLAQYNLDANKIKVIVSKEAASMIGTTANLRYGMILSLNQLFYGMMLPSGNDAAFQIALIGGTIINLSRQNRLNQQIMYNAETLSYETSRYNNNIICFLAKMNTLGKYKVKLYSTNFANPHGLSNTSSLSTAEDMAILTGYALKNSHFRRIVQTKAFSCQYSFLQPQKNDQNSDPNLINNCLEVEDKQKRLILSWENTNKLLWNGFSGVKTGITPNAGPCLSASMKKQINGKQHEFVVILLKSFSMEARWNQATNLIEWAASIIKK